jgi:hypothetical protein
LVDVSPACTRWASANAPSMMTNTTVEDILDDFEDKEDEEQMLIQGILGMTRL